MRRSRRHRRHVCAACLSAFKTREAAKPTTVKIAEARGLWALRGRLSPWVVNRKRAPLLSSTTGVALQIYKGLLSVYSGHHKLKTFAAYSQDINARFVGFERYICFSVSICTAALQ